MTPLSLMAMHGSSENDQRYAGFSLEPHCFHHRRFKHAVRSIAELHHYTLQNNLSGGVVLSGLSGLGKSRVMKYYAENFPRKSESGVLRIPVLTVDTPSAPTVKSLAQQILSALGDPAAHRGTEEEKTQRIYNFLNRCQVEVIIFDEFHHFFYAKTTNIFRQISDWLKNLMNAMNICVVLSGLPEAEDIVKSNAQLHRRFSAAVLLTPFSIEDEEDFREFRGLLRAFQERLPIPVVTPIYEANLARRFLIASGGRLDYLRKVLEGAVAAAGSVGAQEMDLQHYEAGFRARIWGTVSDRLNPFHPNSIQRPLEKPGEPYETGGYSSLIGSPVAVRLGWVGRKKGGQNDI